MQYVIRESAFHRLHPLTKLIFAAVVVVLAVLTSDTAMLAVLAGAVVAVAIASGLARDLLRQVPLLLMLAVSLLALTILTIRSGEVIGYLVPQSVPVIGGGALPVTAGAIDLALAMSLRFAAMLFAFQLLIISTQPRDLVHVMDRLRMPVDYTLMLLIALRFIPSLQLEGKRIHEAQLARAYNPGNGLAGKIRGALPPHHHPVGLELARESHDPRADDRSPRLPFRQADADARPCSRPADVAGSAAWALWSQGIWPCCSYNQVCATVHLRRRSSSTSAGASGRPSTSGSRPAGSSTSGRAQAATPGGW